MTRDALLKQIQATDFALYDAVLFLDSHPTDAKALAYFHKTKESLKELRDAYEKTFGPLTAEGVTNRTYWDWLNEPWPWETGE